MESVLQLSGVVADAAEINAIRTYLKSHVCIVRELFRFYAARSRSKLLSSLLGGIRRTSRCA